MLAFDTEVTAHTVIQKQSYSFHEPGNNFKRQTKERIKATRNDACVNTTYA